MTTDVQLLDLLQEHARFHQPSLVEYIFMANFKHQEIATELKAGANKKALRNKILDLDEYLKSQFSAVAEKTFEYLKKYFTKEFCSQRSEIPLRISIKVITDDEIVSLERFPRCKYEDFESKASENSAFEHLAKGNEYYFCNSIPMAIDGGKYKNNRIDLVKAKSYIQKITNGNITIDHESLDIQWANCWKKVKYILSSKMETPSPTSCYKSTIVVPIALNPDDLSSDIFKNKFNRVFYLSINDEMHNGKIILGYLCLDHPLESYFKEDTDVKLTDMFSKCLSLYMLPQLAYTQYSPVYFDALEAIGDLIG